MTTRKFLIIAAAALSLSGCATTGQAPADNSVISQIQQTASQICGFLPAANTVASIIAPLVGFGPEAALVGQIASEICAAATSKSARRGHRPTVRGVPLSGRFVR